MQSAIPKWEKRTRPPARCGRTCRRAYEKLSLFSLRDDSALRLQEHHLGHRAAFLFEFDGEAAHAFQAETRAADRFEFVYGLAGIWRYLPRYFPFDCASGQAKGGGLDSFPHTPGDYFSVNLLWAGAL